MREPMGGGMTRRDLLHLGAALSVLLVIVAGGLAQMGRVQERGMDDVQPPRSGEFHFLRVEYTDLPQYHRRWGYASRDGMGAGWWLVDWRPAKNHSAGGVDRLPQIDTGDPRHIRLTDPRLFD